MFSLLKNDSPLHHPTTNKKRSRYNNESLATQCNCLCMVKSLIFNSSSADSIFFEFGEHCLAGMSPILRSLDFIGFS